MITVAGFLLTGTSLTVSKVIMFTVIGLWLVLGIILKIKGGDK